MLAMYREYALNHHRFKEHLRVAIVMAMVAPVCALIFFNMVGWWNPWLWGSCGLGLSLALSLYSVVLMHRNPPGLSRPGQRLVDTSPEWFPLFFIVIQSLIASLIVLFMWFSVTALALRVPLHVHVLLISLCLLIPMRRVVWAKLEKGTFGGWYLANEVLRAAWHTLLTVFMARLIITLTIKNPDEITSENLVWQTIVWVPSLLYIIFTLAVTFDHLFRAQQQQQKVPATPAAAVRKDDEPMDRF